MSTPINEPTSSPSAGRPEVGEIRVGETTLSKAAYWVEARLHVFRSLEYDVIAADEDKLTAVRLFIEKSEDYARFLSEGPLVAELQLANLIYRRLLDGYEAISVRHAWRVATTWDAAWDAAVKFQTSMKMLHTQAGVTHRKVDLLAQRLAEGSDAG